MTPQSGSIGVNGSGDKGEHETTFGGLTRFVAMTGLLACSLWPSHAQAFQVEDFGLSPNDAVSAIAIQPDGKVVIGGRFTQVGSQPRHRLARLHADGTLDQAFTPNADFAVYAIALLDDGKIMVGGAFKQLNGQPIAGLARLHPDGSIDGSFQTGLGGYASVDSISVEPSGSLLVAGYTDTGIFLSDMWDSTHNFQGVARLNADGSPHWTAGPLLVERDSGDGRSRLVAVAQRDGKFIVGGHRVSFGYRQQNPLVRFHVNGTLDTTFVATQPTRSGALVTADGQILLQGARLNVDGSVDATYTSRSGVPLALQADGRVWVMAREYPEALVQLNKDGSPNAGARWALGGGWAEVKAMAIQSDGRIWIGGTFASIGGVSRPSLVRLKSTAPAMQRLTRSGTTVTWTREEASPEIWRAALSFTTNGVDWSPWLSGLRIEGGWQWRDVAIPEHATVRARGYSAGSGTIYDSMIGQPAFVLPPSRVAADVGGSARFTALAMGDEPIRYRWHKDGVPIANGDRVSGADASMLYIQSAGSQDSGVYTVEAVNALGSRVSTGASLEVQATLPVIQEQPKSISIKAGEAAAFTVSAAGMGPLGYQWRFDGTHIAGATNATYRIPILQSFHAGAYSVEITNPVGTIVSSNAILTVVPVFTGYLDGAFVESPGLVWTTGGNASWKGKTNVSHDGIDAFASANQSWVETTVQGPGRLGWWWTMWSDGLGAGPAVLSIDGVEADGYQLTEGSLSYAYLAWEFKSILIASGPHTLRWTFNGRSHSVAWLDEVHYGPPAPLISVPPESQVTSEGTRVTLTASAVGSGTLVHQWFRDGVALIASERVFGVDGPNLTIAEALLSDAGGYSVVVTDSYGSVTSKVATLKVLPALSLGEAIDAPELTWRTEGGARWRPVIGDDYHDGSALECSGLSIGQEGILHAEMVGPAQVTFSWLADASLDVYLDEVAVARLSDPTDEWHAATVWVGTGPHTIRWVATAIQPSQRALLDELEVEPDMLSAVTYRVEGHSSAWQSDQGWVSLGTGVGRATFQGNYRYYRVSVSAPAWFDAVRGSDGTYYPQGFVAVGNGGPHEAIIGTPDLYYLYLNGVQGLFGSYFIIENTRHWSSIEIIPALRPPSPPMLSEQPRDQRTAVGSTADFRVSASGDEPLHYQWRFNGANLSDGGRISGARTSDLRIASVQPADAGDYAVVVTNSYGSVTSPLALLTVEAPRTFNLKDYYYPIYPGNQWTYDSSEDGGTWTTRVRVEAQDAPLTFFTGANPVSTYQRPVNSILFDQEDSSWTNHMATGAEGWGYLGMDRSGRPSYRFDPGFHFTNRMSFGQTISLTNDVYADGVYVGLGTFAIRLIDLANVSVPAGSFAECLHLEFAYNIAGSPRVEEAWWAKGVGPVRWTHGSPGSSTVEVNELTATAFLTPPIIVGTYEPGFLVESHPNVRNFTGTLDQRTSGTITVWQTNASYTAVLSDGPNSLTLPNLARTGNRLQNTSRPVVLPGVNVLDFIMVSDGNNRAFVHVGQEPEDPDDISFMVASWSSHTGIMSADDFVGTWDIEAYAHANVRAWSRGFDHEQLTISISRVDAEHIQVQLPHGAELVLRVSGNKAFLESPPVGSGSIRYHSFRIHTDGQKLSLSSVASELDDLTDVAVSVALGVKQPVLAFTSPLRLANRTFQTTLTGPAASKVVISSSTNLQTWTPLLTNALTDGLLKFTDTPETNDPQRVYRARLWP